MCALGTFLTENLGLILGGIYRIYQKLSKKAKIDRAFLYAATRLSRLDRWKFLFQNMEGAPSTWRNELGKRDCRKLWMEFIRIPLPSPRSIPDATTQQKKNEVFKRIRLHQIFLLREEEVIDFWKCLPQDVLFPRVSFSITYTHTHSLQLLSVIELKRNETPVSQKNRRSKTVTLRI